MYKYVHMHTLAYLVIFWDIDFSLIFGGYWPIGLVGKVFANGLEDRGSIPGWVTLKTLKMVLNAILLDI